MFRLRGELLVEDRGRLAGRELADLLGCRDQAPDVSRRVVRGHVGRLVPEEYLATIRANGKFGRAASSRFDLRAPNPKVVRRTSRLSV
jgi:hypothetical protein